MVRLSYPRLTCLVLLATALLGSTLHARHKDSPIDLGARPLRDSEGKLLNYSTESGGVAPTAKGFAPAKSSLGTLAVPAITPEIPEWQYSVFGTSIGSSGLLIQENNGAREIYAGGSARGGFWGNDFWQVLRWDAATANYQQIWVSSPFTAGLVRLAVGNVTGDSQPEIVAALEDGSIIIYKLSDKSIASRISLVSGVRQMRLHDLNSDGVAEIVVTTDTELRAYTSAGALLWTVASAGGNDFVIANMDADAGPEIAITGGSYTAGKVVDVTTRAIQWTYASGFGSSLRAADVDGDGRAELIASAGWYYVYCYDVDTMLPKWSIKTDLDIGAIELANVDTDPLPELLIGDGQWGEIHAYELSTQTQQWQIANPEHGVTQIAVGDVDSDGKLDVLWGAGASSSGEDHLYVADIATLTRKWENIHLDGPFLSPVIGDVDGDGKVELVTCTTESDAGYSSGRILVFDAETRVLRGISAPVCDNYSWTGIRDLKLRDIDGNGALDIMIAADWLYDGTIEIYGFSKQNTFTKKWTNAVRPDGSPFTSAEVIDIDGDGNLEVVAANGIEHTGSDGVYVRFYDLATKQQEWQSVQIGSGWAGITDIEIGDFDHDGRLEVLALVPGQNVTSFDGTQKATDAQITGTFSALVGKPDGSGFLVGDNSGKITPYSYVNNAYLAGTSWSASSEKIDGITLEGSNYWITSGGQLKRWLAPNSLDWASVDFGDFVSPRVAVFDSSVGQKVYLGTRGSFAGFALKAGDTKPIVSLTGSGTLREGTADSVTLTFSLNRAASAPFSVDFSTSGSASLTDYAVQGATPGSGAGQWKVAFAAGETSHTITVSATDDQTLEEPEQVSFAVSASSSYSVGDNGSVTLPITDDEAAARPTVRISGSGSIREGVAGSATITVSLDRAAASPLAVEVSATGTTSSSDFTIQGAEPAIAADRWIVNFAAGETSRSFTVEAVNDNRLESTEFLFLTVVPLVNYIVGTPAQTSVTILDAALMAKPIVSIIGADTIREGKAEIATLTISLNAAPKEPLTVRLSASGTATPSDYLVMGGNLEEVTFSTGEISRMVTVTAVNDLLAEPTEELVVTLQSADEYVVGTNASASVTIEDDECTVSVVATDSEAGEKKGARFIDNGVFTLRRTGSLKKALAVRYAMSGAAMNGADYRTLSGIVTFGAGKDEAVVRIIAKNDRFAEPTEDAVLTLPASSRYRVDPAAGTAKVSIVDDEPVVNISGAKIESNDWGAYASFTLTRNESSVGYPLTVNVYVIHAFLDGSEEASATTVIFKGNATSAKLAMPRYAFGSRGEETITVEILDAPTYHLGETLESSIVLPTLSKL